MESRFHGNYEINENQDTANSLLRVLTVTVAHNVCDDMKLWCIEARKCHEAEMQWICEVVILWCHKSVKTSRSVMPWLLILVSVMMILLFFDFISLWSRDSMMAMNLWCLETCKCQRSYDAMNLWCNEYVITNRSVMPWESLMAWICDALNYSQSSFSKYSVLPVR